MDDNDELNFKYPKSPFYEPDDDQEFYPEHLDLKLPVVSTEAVVAALKDFILPLASGKDFAWLAMAVRRSLGVASMMPPLYGVQI